MKCPDCGEEIGETKKCDKCGTTIKQTQEKENGFEPFRENVSTKKVNKLIWFLLAVIVIIVVLIVYYAVTINRPRYIFDQKISELINSEEQIRDYNTLKANANLEIEMSSSEPEAQELANLLNDTKIFIATELDKNTQEELVGLQLSKADKTLLDAKLKLEAESQNLYINLGELFDKTILTNMAELSDETFEIADTSMTTFGQKITGKKAEAILEEEIKTQLKDEYFSTEKTKIEDENVIKNTLKLSAQEFMSVIKNVCQNLSENEQFINCFEDGEMVKSDLQDMKDSLDDYDIEEDMDIILDVYTTGFNKKVKRVDISVEDDNSKVTVQFTKANEEEYAYQVLEEDEKILEGTIKYNEENDDFNFAMTMKADEVECVIKLSGNTIYDENLSDFDTSNVVEYQELTTEDVYTLLGNIMNSELYQIIQSF